MKLEFELKTDDKDNIVCDIAFEGRTVTVRQRPAGAEVDLNPLPEDSLGRVFIEETWTLAQRLIEAGTMFDERGAWKKASDVELHEMYGIARK